MSANLVQKARGPRPVVRVPGSVTGLGSPSWMCPSCGECRSAVVDSRPNGLGIRRNRICLACNTRHTTYEISAQQLRAIYAAIRTLRKLGPELNGAIEVCGNIGSAEFGDKDDAA